MWNFIVVLVFSVLVMGSPAQATITLDALIPGSTGINAPTDITSYGFGVINPLITLQTPNGGTDYEVGTVTPNFANQNAPNTSGTGIASPAGPPKDTTPTIGSLGITSWSDLALLFNTNEPGDRAIQANQVTLSAYTPGVASPVISFTLEIKPLAYINVEQGQGGSGYILVLDPALLTAQVNALFSPTLWLAMSADLGCPNQTNCSPANAAIAAGDGPDSFTAVSLSHPVPEPSTLLLLGTGLVGFVGAAWRQRRK